ncbi:hypothetical protein JOM56_009506 [Amanita muscaria]
MRLSTIIVSSAALLAGLSAAFPVEGESISGIEARDYDEEPASKDPSHPYRPSSHNHESSHHPRSFYEQSHSDLSRRRDPPLPPGFPYVGQQGQLANHLEAWDVRRTYDNQGRNSPPPRPPTPRPSPPRSPHLSRRRDPPLQPGFPYPNDPGAYNRNLDAWDNRRQYDNQGHSRSNSPSRPHSPRPSTPPRYRRAFYDLD